MRAKIKRYLQRKLLPPELQPDRENPIEAFIREGKVTIGPGTYHMPVIVEYPNDTGLVHIGAYCSIHWDVEIFRGGTHRLDWVAIYGFKALAGLPVEKGEVVLDRGDVVIGNDVYIGRGATIMAGVEIGDGAVVGAKSVVTKKIGPFEIWAGNPARLIRKRFSDDQIDALLRIKWWDWPEDVIKQRVLDLNGAGIDDFVAKYDPQPTNQPRSPANKTL